MVILLLIIGVAILIYASAMWVKFVWYIFRPKKKPLNPYIEAQKVMMDNDKKYEEYIDWMSKNGYGVPIEKIRYKEEKEAEMNIDSVFKRKTTK